MYFECTFRVLLRYFAILFGAILALLPPSPRLRRLKQVRAADGFLARLNQRRTRGMNYLPGIAPSSMHLRGSVHQLFTKKPVERFPVSV